ncbi:MAG: phosphate ABC transporter permease subunit PstC [Thermoleophilia bacterium]
MSSVPYETTDGGELPRGAAGAAPRGASRWGDPLFRGLATACGLLVALCMFGLAAVLVTDSWESISTIGVRFFTTTSWAPSLDAYGALTSLAGTAVTTIVAMAIALPLAMVIAMLLTELVHPAVSRIVGTAIEMLAAIPSIIFGMFGMYVIVPLMQAHVVPWLTATPIGRLPFFGEGSQGGGFSLFTAGIVLAVMVLPFITAVSRDVLSMVPQVVKEAGYGMGSTTWEVMHKISFKHSASGIVGAGFIGLGRALGETMAVAFLVGGVYDRLPTSIFDPGTTIAATIANTFNEAGTSLHVSALIELGLALFVITMAFQLLAHAWLRRVRRVTGGRA